MMKVSVVVNSHNEEKNIRRCLESIKDFADEIVVVDMDSSDKTVDIAKEFGAKIFRHEYTGYVEPARNFAILKASGEWILLIDADEEAPKVLIEKLQKIVEEERVDYVNIPRKNLIFGKWIKHSRWWPDYNMRFFKKGFAVWEKEIHCIPMTKGRGDDFPAEERNAIIHYNYSSISQYLERNNRYSEIRAEELIKKGYRFSLSDLIKKPADEFLSRYFAGEGYKDGLHGLILANLQSFAELIVYLKVWEKEGFKEEEVNKFPDLIQKAQRDLNHWLANKTSKFTERLRFKIKSLI